MPVGRRDAIYLCTAMAAFVALWLGYPHQFNDSDPFWYSLRADYFMHHGAFGHVFDGLPETFDFRLGVILPVALIYKMFGVTILTTHLYPLCAALALIAIVWVALPDVKARLFGLAFCLTSVPLFDGAVDLYRDLIASAWLAASVALLDARLANAVRAGSWPLFPVLAVGCVFGAFLAKESAYWVLPVWFYVFVRDMRSCEGGLLWRRFYLPVLMTGVVLGMFYLWFNAVVWGDPWAQLSTIAAAFAKQRAHPDAWWTIYSGHSLLSRLTLEPALMLYRSFGPVLVFALLGFFVLPRALVVWGVYTASCLALFWFGSTNLSHYDPLPLYPRYILPALPGLYIVAASFAARLDFAGARWPVVGCGLVAVLVLAITAVPYVRYVRGWSGIENGEAAAMQIVRAAVAAQPATAYVLVTADARSAAALAFYFSYAYPENLTVRPAAGIDAGVRFAATRAFLYANETRSAFLSSAYGEKVFNANFRKSGLQVLFEQGGTVLYEAATADALRAIAPERK